MEFHWECADPCRNPASDPLWSGPYGTLFAHHQLRRTGQPRQPYVLDAGQRAERVSAVIPFRDRPDLTIPCLEALAKQALGDTALEVILVDNASTAETMRDVHAAVERLGLAEVTRTVRWDGAFNHSHQCNLGAEAASGDVLLFLNNDCRLLSPDCLTEIAAWTLADGVGVVGPTQVGRDGRITSAGVAPVFVGHDFGAVVQDVVYDPEFAETLHEAPCVSFACAAMSKQTFEAVGRLDPVDFPVAYNDIDFCLRAGEAGLVNVVAGYVQAEHDQFTTRPRTDEAPQRLTLRARHPSLWMGKETMLQVDAERMALIARMRGGG